MHKPAVYSWASIILLLICIGVRCAYIQYDPPSWLSWSSGLYTDEGFYTLDARYAAVFGQTGGAIGNFHDSYGAPLLSAIQRKWFICFGCTLTQARLLSVVFGILTVAAFWIALYLYHGIKTAFAGALFIGLAPPVVFYNALGLQETSAAFCLTASLCLSIAAWRFANRKRAVLLAAFAGALLVCAYLCKSLAIVAMPGLIAAGLTVWRFADKKEIQRLRLAFAVGLISAGALYIAVSWLSHHAELSRMGKYYLTHQLLPHKISTVLWNLRRAFVVKDQGVIAFLLGMMPVPFALALSRWRLSGIRCDAAIWLWLFGGVLFCTCSNYSPSRYYILFIPALCWIAALQWSAFDKKVRRATTGIFLAGFVFWYGSAWMHRQNTVMQAQQLVQSKIPANGIMIGDFAPQLTLGSKIKSALVIPGLANDTKAMENLHADYIVLCRSNFWDGWWRSHYPQIINPEHLYLTTVVGPNEKYRVDIYKTH